MKKMILLMLVCIMLVPIGVRAQDRTWWPDQIDESDEYHDLQKIGEWPGDVLTNEIAVDTILFRPKVAAVQPLSRSVKVLVDATTAARNIMVKYTVDGRTWEQRSYRNVGYKGPVTCTRKWQIKLYAKEDRYTSWCARQFKQAGKTVAYKRTPTQPGQMAQLFFDDYLIDGIRRKVPQPVIINIPAKAKRFKIRYVYTGLKKDLFSEWVEIKVR